MRNTLVAMAALVALSATQACGGILANDVNGLSGWQGTILYDGLYVDANLDYSVYTQPGFALSFPDPAALIQPNHYVYAYQIDVVAGGGIPSWEYVIQFSVGLHGDEQGDIIGAYDDGSANLVMPSSAEFSTDLKTAKWYFSSKITVGEHSGILYFSSPFGPETDQGSLLGAMPIAQHNVPSPTPEPATLALLGLGGLAILRRRRHAA